MKCPYCSHEVLKVTDSRNAPDANAIRRRRECLECSQRFTTFEMVEPVIQVCKRDGVYEDFQEQKLVQGLESACRHTRVGPDQVRSLVSKVTRDLMDRHVREISTKEIGEIVMKYLKKIDTIAYIRFACVYRRFRDIGELMEAIHSINPEEDVDEMSRNVEESHGVKEVSS